jgi:nucleotide-binding universal stress UspA family protein
VTDVTAPVIVVGIDGSDSSKSALSWAIAEARLRHAHIQLISTWEYPTAYGWTPPEIDVDLDAETRGMQADVLASIEHADLEITPIVLEGHPAPILVEASKSATLLVLGRSGHGAFTGMLLGSTSQYLATHSYCPLVIVREQGDRP